MQLFNWKRANQSILKGLNLLDTIERLWQRFRETGSIQEDIEYAWSDEQIAEVLSKRLSYFLDKGGDLNKIQPFLDARNIKIVQKLENFSTGFSSFLFRKGNNSICIFIGANDRNDWVTNSKMEEIGRFQFELSKIKIWFILNREKKYGRKIIVCGHSLGGALSQITVSEFPELIDEVMTFNSAGVNKDTSIKFDGFSNIKVTHFINKGDIVSLFGESFISGDIKYFENATGFYQDKHKVLLTSSKFSREIPVPKWLIKKATI